MHLKRFTKSEVIRLGKRRKVILLGKRRKEKNRNSAKKEEKNGKEEKTGMKRIFRSHKVLYYCYIFFYIKISNLSKVLGKNFIIYCSCFMCLFKALFTWPNAL